MSISQEYSNDYLTDLENLPDYIESDNETITDEKELEYEFRMEDELINEYQIAELKREKNKLLSQVLRLKNDKKKLENKLEKTNKINEERVKIIIEKSQLLKEYRFEKCAICHEIEGIKIVTKCNHLYHKECINIWNRDNNKKCPLCRGDLEYNLFEFETQVIERLI